MDGAQVRAVFMGTKYCRKILNFSTRFSCEYFSVENFVTVFMGENLVGGEMFSMGMVSTNLSRLFYAREIQIQITEGWKWRRIFSQ